MKGVLSFFIICGNHLPVLSVSSGLVGFTKRKHRWSENIRPKRDKEEDRGSEFIALSVSD